MSEQAMPPELLLKAAKELAEYASYAEIVGGITVNKPQVRKWCDAVFDIIRTLPEDENYEPTFATPTVLAADPAVKALIAAERERCAGECDRTAREADMFGDKHGRQISERTAAAIRGEKP